MRKIFIPNRYVIEYGEPFSAKQMDRVASFRYSLIGEGSVGEIIMDTEDNTRMKAVACAVEGVAETLYQLRAGYSVDKEIAGVGCDGRKYKLIPIMREKKYGTIIYKLKCMEEQHEIL